MANAKLSTIRSSEAPWHAPNGSPLSVRFRPEAAPPVRSTAEATIKADLDH